MAPLEGSELAATGSVLTAAGADSPGAGPAAATLAAVYAAGAGAPITDDLMAMLHGNLRFQSTVDSQPLPIVGYFEDATGEATAFSGYPSELWSLAVVLGTTNGRRFSVYQMMNPTWDGTFAAINAMSWETERVTFSADPINEYKSQNQNPAFGARLWKTLNHWASAAYPQGSSVNGTVEHDTELYNTIDLGLRLVDQLDGWGQTNRELTPQNNGVTWQWASHWNAANIAGAANDGIGWGIYSGDILHTNHLQAGLAAKQVTGDPLGNWFWDLLVADGSGGLTSVGTFALTGVVFPAPVTTPASSSTIQHTTGDVYTLDINCVGATGADKGTIVPARVGAIFVISRWAATVVAKTGPAVTTAPLFNVGSIAATYAEWLNGTSSPLTAGAINEGPAASGASNVVATNAAPTVGGAIHAGLSQAQVGATTLVIRIAVTGYWTTVP